MGGSRFHFGRGEGPGGGWSVGRDMCSKNGQMSRMWLERDVMGVSECAGWKERKIWGRET